MKQDVHNLHVQFCLSTYILNPKKLTATLNSCYITIPLLSTSNCRNLQDGANSVVDGKKKRVKP
jgi:hypothetical protein